MMNKMCMAAVIAASLYAGTTFAQPAAVKNLALRIPTSTALQIVCTGIKVNW